MFGLDNKEITSLEELCQHMVSAEILDSRVDPLILDLSAKNQAGTEHIADLRDFYKAQRRDFIKYHRHLEGRGLTMIVGIGRESGDFGVYYAKSLHDAYKIIDDYFSGMVFLCAFNVLDRKYGITDRAGVIYTGKPQEPEQDDISNGPTKIMPAVA